VRGQTYPSFDIIVVNSGGEDHRTREIANGYGARYLQEPLPGISRARNRGALASTADLVAFVDDDAVPQPGWLFALSAEFADPRVMAATGRIVLEAASAEPEVLRECAAYDKRRPDRHLVIDREHPDWRSLTNFGGLGDGANMAFRREAFDVWPGFDTRLGRGAAITGSEEHYAFFRLVSEGFRVSYSPSAVVTHPSAATGAELAANRRRDLFNSAAYVTLILVEHPEHCCWLLSKIARWTALQFSVFIRTRTNVAVALGAWPFRVSGVLRGLRVLLWSRRRPSGAVQTRTAADATDGKRHDRFRAEVVGLDETR
jgi:cellulose synthase/poly-beta-1,6-N-acetylglucosamine synthase-like glycosyltransferase